MRATAVMKSVYASAAAFLDDALNQKRDRRLKLARLPFGEKIALVEKMRLELEPMRHARTVNKPQTARAHRVAAE